MAASLKADFDSCGGAQIKMWRYSKNVYRKQGLISTSPFILCTQLYSYVFHSLPLLPFSGLTVPADSSPRCFAIS